MTNIVLLVILAGLVVFCGYKYHKENRAKALTRQR